MTLSYKVRVSAPLPPDMRRGGPASAAPAPKAADAAPALFRLLADSALYRAAFAACGYPMAIIDAVANGHPVVQVNAAFERVFGIADADARGKPLVSALFRGDHVALQRLLEKAEERAALRAWCKNGTALDVEASAGAMRDVKGERTHWIVTFSPQVPSAPIPNGTTQGDGGVAS